MDWVAGILELTGLYVVGNKNRIGFIFNILCGICWIVYVFTTKSTYGLLAVVIPALVINVINFSKWKIKKSKWKAGKVHSDNFYRRIG